MSGPRRIRRDLALLLVVLVGACVLRFCNLGSRGLIYWDEAKFALEGERMQALILRALHVHSRLDAGKAVGTAKPTHALLIGAAYLLFGIHDWVPLVVNAAASVAAVLITWQIGTRLFSPNIGLLSAALLAVSEYEGLYARSALSESDGTVLLLVAILLCLPRSRVNTSSDSPFRIVAAALVMGLAFTVNYRLIVYIGSFVALDLFLSWRRLGSRDTGARACAWVAGVCVAPLLWQVVGVLCAHRGVYLFRNEVSGAPQTYVREVLYQIHEGKQSVVRFSPVPYLEWFGLREGPFVSLFVVVGLIAAARYRSAPWLYTVVPAFVPFAVYLFAPFIVPRNLEAALPFASILAATGVREMAHGVGASVRGRDQSPPAADMRSESGESASFTWSIGRTSPAVQAWLLLTAALVALELFAGAWMSWRLTAERSGFASATSYVKKHGAAKLLTSTEVMEFYFAGTGATCSAPPLPLRLSGLKADVEAGYRYAVLERHTSTVSAYIRSRAHLVATFPEVGAMRIWENPVSSENSDPPDPSEPQDVVSVYDLTGLHFAPGIRATARVAPCRRDHVA
jgi:4-amino-4-deoxy-L-arabinose transferase-like glycosyltransferase